MRLIPDGPELARPAVLALALGQAGLDVEPFAFKPLELMEFVDSKSLENLERLGGIVGLTYGLRTNSLWGLSTSPGSPDPDTPYGAPVITSTVGSSAGVTEGLQGAASLNASGLGRPASFSLSAPDKATIDDRQRIYGQNILPQRPSKGLLRLMWLELHDKVLVLLSIATVVSLALGAFLDFSSARLEGEPSVDWAQCSAIIVAILIVVFVGSLNKWQKEKQFKALNEKKEDRLVKVIRDGRERQIHVHQVVVGDVALLEPGDIIPCDGVFLTGHNVLCDESSAKGESDAIKKLSYGECIALRDKQLMALDPGGPSGGGESVDVFQGKTNASRLGLLGRADCFIVSGSKVLEGVGSYVVMTVGARSLSGRTMMALPRESENTPLQLQLNDLAEEIKTTGSIAGGLFFVALLFRYFYQPGTNDLQRGPSDMGVAFVNILKMAVILVIVALPEALPLAANLALAFATRRMTKDNLLVHLLGSCEATANVSVICTDKTGTLTQNKMTVVAGSVGVHGKFVRRLEENCKWTGSGAQSGSSAKDFCVDLAHLNAVLPHPLKALLNVAIAINSTAFEGVNPESGAPVFIGSITESALLGLAKELGWPNYKDTRDSAKIIQMIPFSSARKFMGSVVRLPDGSHRIYVKGASEILTRNCTRHVVVGDSAPKSANAVETAPIGEPEEGNISHAITFYSSQALHTIALCYRDFPSWPPKGTQLWAKDQARKPISLMTDLTLIAIIAIENPLRPGVREAAANCGRTGIRVKMCTGDNVLTARSIAQQCGIYTAGGVVMEGPHFRTLSPDCMKAVVPRLQVLARSSPEDKRILVETLKELGDVVGVTGEGTNDGPALRTAHVGFSMGIVGTEVAKEASDIVLMDDNFSSIVNAIMWGRCVHDSVRKFLQFQISTNVTAIVVMFVWALASSKEEPVLSAIQLLWINIIMGTFAALALATDPASPALLERKPDKMTDPLLTVNMTKQILGQAVYQIIMILFFHFLGSQILGFHHTDDSTLQKHHADVVQTLVFNAFVFAQISNSFNCRRLDRKLNVFEGMTKNWYFVAVTTIGSSPRQVAVQVSICLFGGSAFGVTRIGAREWAISLALGCFSLPLSALIRLTPNEPSERAFKKLQLMPIQELLPTTRLDDVPSSSSAIDYARNNLGDGSMNGSSLVRKRRCAFPVPADSPCLEPDLLAMDPSHASPDIVVAPDWQSRASSSGSLSGPAGLDSPRLSATLWENRFEVHPDTSRDDPVYTLLGMTQ
ncbi:calcium-translocating P-type ATPase [Lactarius quietus]|nr:calcium-translocating P-type ATPase [Lactarius quietus]